jgi:hypothetical protein
MLHAPQVRKTLEIAQELRLLQESEARYVAGAFAPDSPFASAIGVADTLHVHVKVDAVHALPRAELRAAGGTVENEKDGYIKYAFASGMNLIFSSIAVSQDDLRETADTRRPRPFLDHYGIDLRREAEEVRAVFDAVPATMAKLGFAHAAQGSADKRVFCCHTSVERKHWLFARGQPSVEIAYGALTVQAGKSGCDLRPSDPRTTLHSGASSACCAEVKTAAVPVAADKVPVSRRAVSVDGM